MWSSYVEVVCCDVVCVPLYYVNGKLFCLFSFSCNLQETDIDSGTKISILCMLYEQHLHFHISTNNIIFRDADFTVRQNYVYVPVYTHVYIYIRIILTVYQDGAGRSFLSALGHAS